MSRVLLLLFALTVSTLAYADCEDDLKVLAPRVQAISDPGTKRRAERYLIRALRELDEGDELDCQPAADAVRAFLEKSQKQQ
jgi:hypothetical protein